MELIKDPMIELDVFSNCQVYGKDFADANDKQYQALYDHAKKLPNVNYLGFRNNEWIKKHLKNYNMFVYPSIWEETFCISLLEAMAAGLYCIVSNYGALYETGAEYPMYLTHSKNYHFLARKCAIGIESAKKTLDQPAIIQHLNRQVEYANTYYGWPKIAMTWTHLLKGILNEK